MSGLIGCLSAVLALCAPGQEVRLDSLQIVHALSGRWALTVNERGEAFTSGGAESFYRDGRYSSGHARHGRQGSYYVSGDQICVAFPEEKTRRCRYVYKIGLDYYFSYLTEPSSRSRINIGELE